MGKEIRHTFIKILVAVFLVTSMSSLVTGGIGEVEAKASTYTEKKGSKTYQCKKQTTLSANQVKKAAKQTKKATNATTGIAIVAGYFNKHVGAGTGVFAYGLGTSASKWKSAADKNQKARRDVCTLKSPKYNGYNGPLQYNKHYFYK